MKINFSQDLKLPFLKKGDLVDIVAPASPAIKSEIKMMKSILAKYGLKARFYMEEELSLKRKPDNNFAFFSPQKRFEQLRYALENKDSKAIWCVRGGYGSAEIIPLLETLQKMPQTKLFIGFSDITSLNIFFQTKWNWQLIYGPMLAQMAQKAISTKSQNEIFDVVMGKKKELHYAMSKISLDKNNAKLSAANLVGGCLSVLVSSFATSSQIDWQDKILFLEDIDEAGERMERYFTQIIAVMQKTNSYPRAILLGNFTELATNSILKKNIAIAIANFCKNLHASKINIPVFQEKRHCLGHAKNMMPVVIGCKGSFGDEF